MASFWPALAVAVVAVIGVGAFTSLYGGLSTGGTPTAAGGGATSTRTACTSGQSTTASSTQAGGTSVVGSFSAPSSVPVKVDSVVADVYQGSAGETVAFYVGFENVGPSAIYTVTGCGSSLTAAVPAGSGVLEQQDAGPRCLCAEAPAPVAPGQSGTAATPGCWSGYQFDLVGPGTVTVTLTLAWGYGEGGASSLNDTTTVTAQFTFS
ncbi:MAG: hypothetical protein JRN21_04345 [Nitrososphaerota archaeon]|nr:hypothetical protein [Nitrososphaerota archaeon]